MKMMEAKRNEMAALLRLLGHPVRLHITLLLHQLPQTVSALEATLHIRQPTLSQHLAALREAGVVSATREAQSVTYAINDGLPASLATALSALVTHSSTPAPHPAPHHQGDELVFARLHFPDDS